MTNKQTRGGSQLNFLDEIIVDNFAGGGGASTGMELATGRPVAIAINHDPDAILMHRTNHPYTEHLQASVWDVDPREVCRGRPVGLAWFSPDCKHFSKAKGAALVDRNIRGLAWIVLRWAGTVRPRVIILENVEEFVTWGPVRKGKPVKKKAGQTFQKWKRQLLELGYQVEHREIVAADLGAPTTRKRFVLVARCDGRPIVWPERTHGPRDSEEVRDGRLMPWKSAAEIIDWSVLCYSVFASKRELKEKYGVNAVRPLRTITASAGEFADCRAELMEAGSQDLMHWPEVRDLLNRHCGYEMADDEILLLEIGGGLYFIADILLRMLTPRELYNAMGFPPDYIIDRDHLGNKYGKTKQVARCGNAVCPPMATALVRANLPEWCSRTITTMEELEKAVTA
jgi:site-specific DNA-cytosine methylase